MGPHAAVPERSDSTAWRVEELRSGAWAGQVVRSPSEPISEAGWYAMAGLGAVMALSRLFMFVGLGRLGGIQTALLGLSEPFVTLLVAFMRLGERLTPWQWLGGA